LKISVVRKEIIYYVYQIVDGKWTYLSSSLCKDEAILRAKTKLILWNRDNNLDIQIEDLTTNSYVQYGT
jgi:hypothetical protein